MFPTKSGREFSPAFPKTAVHLYTQFLRIFAHLYHAHFRDILHLSLEAHLNVSRIRIFTLYPFISTPFPRHKCVCANVFAVSILSPRCRACLRIS